jgi:hypothetical protein
MSIRIKQEIKTEKKLRLRKINAFLRYSVQTQIKETQKTRSFFFHFKLKYLNFN